MASPTIVTCFLDALPCAAAAADSSLRILAASNARDFTRIVGNLIANAIKFSEAGGTVDCEIVAEDGWVRLVVAVLPR
jgi:signal transduction histidine kinase